jgi:hypothetical protein
MSEKALYRHFWRCRMCSNRFHTDRATEDASAMNPRCPKCKGKAKESFVADKGFDPGEGKAPAVVGANVQVKAYDMALDICAKDQGLTDIQTHRYEGEGTAPKLRPDLQRQVDGFWSGAQKRTKKTAVDLSPIYGDRAKPPANATRFKADTGSLLDPIMRGPNAQPGASAVPAHTVIAGDRR